MNLRVRKLLSERVRDALDDPRLREHSLEFRDLLALLGQWETGVVSGLMQAPVPVDLHATPGVQYLEP